MYYKKNNEGLVVSIGISPEFGDLAKGDEPFGMGDSQDWQLVNNEWVNIKINYQYIIIPADITNELAVGIVSVQSIDVEDSFDVIFEKVEATDLNGNKTVVPCMTLKMIPCKIIEYTQQDNQQMKGIIDYWNEFDERQITFPCHFINEQSLLEFKNIQKLY